MSKVADSSESRIIADNTDCADFKRVSVNPCLPAGWICLEFFWKLHIIGITRRQKWEAFKDVFGQEGVQIDFLCPSE